MRLLSYLPLSHVVGIQWDLTNQLLTGCEIYFARPDALQGGLIDSMRWARPTYLIAVPRVWEKLEIKLREIVETHEDETMRSLFQWAQKHGFEKVKAMENGEEPSIGFEMANSMVI